MIYELHRCGERGGDGGMVHEIKHIALFSFMHHGFDSIRYVVIYGSGYWEWASYMPVIDL